MTNKHPPGEGEERFDLDCWSGKPYLMPAAHWHDEIEINLVVRGVITYLAGGTSTTLAGGQLAVFWGAMPHRVTAIGDDTVLAWLTLPLANFLSWALPDTLRQVVLHGRFVSGLAHDVGASRAGFERWTHDLHHGSHDDARTVLLEVEAALLRLARHMHSDAARISFGEHFGHAERMCTFIAAHYTEPLTVADIAAATHLNPTYAMGVFRAALDRTIMTYLTQYRVAHAQRLLATTNDAILDVAFACGFGSQSRFYEAFRASCGQTPRAYRTMMRNAAPKVG